MGLYWPVFLLWVVVIVADVLVRIWPNSGRYQIAALIDDSVSNVEPEAIFSDLALTNSMSKLGDHRLVNGSVIQSTKMVEVEPVIEDGWSSSVSNYHLLAIYEGLERFAVLKKVDLESGEESVVRIREGEFMDDFLLVSISSAHITLSDQVSGGVTLRLFAASDGIRTEAKKISIQVEK